MRNPNHITLVGGIVTRNALVNAHYDDNTLISITGSLMLEAEELNDFPAYFNIISETLNIKDNSFTGFSKRAPKSIGDCLYASRNKIKSLKNIPLVSCSIVLENNFITKLEYLPTRLNCLNIAANELSSLKGITEHIDDHLIISHNEIKSLRDVHKHIVSCDTIDVSENPIEEGGIGLLLIEGLKHITCDKTVRIFNSEDEEGTAVYLNPQDPMSRSPKYHPRRYRAMEIINKYLALGGGKQYLLPCANELENHGLERFALL